ncbi:substrate-binding domain-containing protein [Massilia pinisoli]|uniref:Substrate-binding domain-containing protein n=1 Tax=Massilia pinisoli TaxID=1772194 RepID=A0ABT1ZKM8_9BURK|nr:substrate-binding domain-containing protein [Massilia pinisoli]MCS0580469.1 substrate-binding domain-containing protein [Massilia pinisoli]
MHRRDACIMLAGAGMLATAACTPAPAVQESLLVAGAAAMVPLARALAQAFVRGRAGVSIVIERGGSLPAYIAASRAAIDVAAMTRALSDTEDDAGARQYLIARDDIGIVVNPGLALGGLTRAQVRAAFAGEIANWRALGGPDAPLTVYVHARSATARRSAEHLLLGGGALALDARECADDAALAAAVAADPTAIGYLPGHARAGATGVALLAVDGVEATRATVLSGRYPFTHSFHLLLHGAPGRTRAEFVRFARSPAGQAIVERLGLVAVC